MIALIEAARAALLKIQRFALIDPPHMATLANIAMAADEGITALAAAETQTKPLTDAQIAVISAKAGFSPSLVATDGGAFARLARAIEHAHGIGELK